MHFGAALRLLRIDSGLSLRALASRVGVSSAYLSRVEHGHDAVPTPDRLEAIAHALSLPAPLLVELAQQVGPFVSRYLERVPAANLLFLDIARRNLSGPQLARIKAFIDEEFPTSLAAEARLGATLSALLAPERVVLQLAGADLTDIIDIAASRLVPPDGRWSASAIARLIVEREREASTALGNGVAVPHAVVEGVAPAAALVTLARPLRAETPDGDPLRLFVVLVTGKSGRTHLETLAQVARLTSHGFVDPLCRARDPGELLAQLAQLEETCR